MMQKSFKERVKIVAIEQSKKYQNVFVDYEYLVCSNAFELKDFYILSAEKNNYLHLIGINSFLSPIQFFNKCITDTLLEEDFDFLKRGQKEGEVIGSVRRKIIALQNIMTLFSKELFVQENFHKNKLICTFAITEGDYTIGFIGNDKSRPNTLLKGNVLDPLKSKKVNLILRRKKGLEKFNEIIIGDIKTIKNYYDIIKNHIDTSKILQQEIILFT